MLVPSILLLFQPYFLLLNAYTAAWAMFLNPIPNSKLKTVSNWKFADDNFKFDEKWQKVLQTGKKHHRKRRNFSLQAISLFPSVFKRLVLPTRKNQGWFVKGLIGLLQLLSIWFCLNFCYVINSKLIAQFRFPTALYTATFQKTPSLE